MLNTRRQAPNFGSACRYGGGWDRMEWYENVLYVDAKVTKLYVGYMAQNPALYKA